MKLLAPLDETLFAPDFEAARAGFEMTLDTLPRGLLQWRQSHPHPLPGPAGEQLSCETVLLSASPEPKALLVLISGTHGGEGFAGSAIQCDQLPLLAPLLQATPQLGVLMIHALNPWGFAWLRRCDHEGIDINRNFIDFNAPLPQNPLYARLHAALVGEPHIPLTELLRREPTMEANQLEAELTLGQYQFSDGLFYGGKGPSWSRQLLESLREDGLLHSAGRIAVIDLHTGLGPYGYGELINDHPLNSPGFALAQRWYGNNALSTESGESVSAPKLGLLDFFWHDVAGDRGCFVTLEFGTWPASVMLKQLRAEQAYHNQVKGQRDIDHPSVKAMAGFFCPRESSWQQMVLLRARQAVGMAITGVTS